MTRGQAKPAVRNGDANPALRINSQASLAGIAAASLALSPRCVT
jgi:hypothetical protein